MKYTVSGKIYSDTATYYSWDSEKRWKNFNALDGTEQTWTIEASSLDEAERWFAKNHPERYMGGSIVSEDKQSFLLLAVPSIEYGIGNYESNTARINWVRAHFA